MKAVGVARVKARWMRILMSWPLVTGLACSSRPPDVPEPQRNDPTTVRLLTEALDGASHPCLRHPPPAAEEQEISPAQVYVEAVLIELPGRSTWPSRLDALASVPNVPGARLVSTPHLIAEFDTAATIKVERVLPEGSIPEPGIFWTSLTLLPKLAGPNILLDMDIEFQTAERAPESSFAAVNVGTHTRNTFASIARHPVVAGVKLPGYSSGTVLIVATPYLLQNQRDLKDIFECKMRRRLALNGAQSR